MKPLPSLAAIAVVATAFLASPSHAALKVGAKEGATVIGVTAGKLDELAAFSKETEHCGGKFPVAADAGPKIAHVYSELKPTDHVKETLDAVKALKSPKPKA